MTKPFKLLYFRDLPDQKFDVNLQGHFDLESPSSSVGYITIKDDSGECVLDACIFSRNAPKKEVLSDSIGGDFYDFLHFLFDSSFMSYPSRISSFVYIDRVEVGESLRGGNVGLHMVAALRALLRTMGSVPVIFLNPSPLSSGEFYNAKLAKYYRKMGFTRYKRTKYMYLEPEEPKVAIYL